MVLGGLLMNSPIRMIFSLLLMQGISLTMFRALLNQTIRHVDPLRFQLNLGNTNLTSSTTTGNDQTSSSNFNWSALFSQLLQSQKPVPTPAPLIDSKVVDLIHLLRSLQLVSTQMNNPSTVQTVPQMSAPIIAWPQVLSTSTTTTSTTAPPISNGHPQIIILPHYTTNTIERLHSNLNPDDSKMDASGLIPVSTMRPDYDDEWNSIPKRKKKIKKKKLRLNKKQQPNIELVRFNDEFSFGGHDDN